MAKQGQEFQPVVQATPVSATTIAIAQAYPVVVQTFIDSLSGFPGPYSSYIFNTIGNNGILKLIGDNRDAQFVAIIAFCDSSNEPTLFESSVAGTISKNIRDGGWGYDPIFIPKNQNLPALPPFSFKTYAELDDKNKLSHRYEALKKFASWFEYKQG